MPRLSAATDSLMYMGRSRIESPLPTPEMSRQMNSVAKLVLKMLEQSAPAMEQAHASSATDLRPYASARWPPTSMDAASLSVAVALTTSSCADVSWSSSRTYCSDAARLTL